MLVTRRDAVPKKAKKVFLLFIFAAPSFSTANQHCISDRAPVLAFSSVYVVACSMFLEDMVAAKVAVPTEARHLRLGF